MPRTSQSQQTRRKHRNDALTIFFWGVVFYLLCFSALAIFAALGNTVAEATLLVLAIIFLGTFWFYNSVDFDSSLYLIDRDPEEKGRFSKFFVVMGSVFIVFTLTLNLLVALKAPFFWTSEHFVKMPEIVQVVSELILATMAGFAFLKFRIASSLMSEMAHVKVRVEAVQAQVVFNKIFRYLAYSSTGYVMAFFVIDANGGAPVTVVTVVLNLSLVLFYGFHNRVLARLCTSNQAMQEACPETKKRKHGELVAYTVMLFCGAIPLAQASGALEHTPLLLILFSLGTGAILVITVVRPAILIDRIAAWALRRRNVPHQ